VRIIINCGTVTEAIELLKDLQRDIDNDEEYLADPEDGDTIYTDFGSVEF